MRDALRLAGSFDVLVNCAGVGVYQCFLQSDDDDFDNLMAVHFHAARRITHALLPAMLECARGHIFHIASMSARVGPWGHTAYSASKGAMRSYAEALSCELIGTGVRATLVYPGIVRTPYFTRPGMQALWDIVGKRAITPDAVARATVRAIGSRRAAVYVPGFYRFIDYCAALSPALALRLVRAHSASPHPLPAHKNSARPAEGGRALEGGDTRLPQREAPEVA